MPVTLKTASHGANQWFDSAASTPDEHFQKSCPSKVKEAKRIIRSSASQSYLAENHVSASRHGFVYALTYAYSRHYHLTIRPEDVWFSILNQVNFYINAHAEELRSKFVAHEGQKELTISGPGTMESADFGGMAVRMTELIEENVIDPDLREWIMPTFSTTTSCDEIVAAILMMGSMQQYFSYGFMLMCGIPSVTLLGEKSDWELLYSKLDKLSTLGEEPTKFAELLRPILHMFVASFDDPTSDKVREFWSKPAHHVGGGSGPTYLSGWVTAFCFWDEEGRCKYDDAAHQGYGVFDGVKYHCVDTDRIPLGSSAVPVTVTENDGTEFKTMMLAGMVGIQATASGEPFHESEETGLDSIQPLAGWWMYIKNEEKEGDGEGEGEIEEYDEIL